MKLFKHKAWLVFIAAILLRLGWNLLHPHDLYLDSWVMVHILDSLTGHAVMLPRAAITLCYPVSYVPFLLPAALSGGFNTVKYFYPVISSLVVVPAYFIFRKGPAPAAGAFAVLLFSDISFKTLTGTPQAVAIPLFFLALYFLLNRRHTAFVLTATVILFTHHLTGMVTLVLYFTLWVLPGSRQPGFLRREWPYLLFFALWPFYWAWTFSLSGQTYLVPVFLILYFVIGLPVAILLYLTTPFWQKNLDYWGAKIAATKASSMFIGVIIISVLVWLLTLMLLRLPIFSHSPVTNSLFAITCASVIVLGIAALLVRRDIGLALFILALICLAGIVLLSGYNTIFDGLRLVDFILLGVTVVIFMGGLPVLWTSRAVLFGVTCVVILAYGLHFAPGYALMFSYTSGEYEAAQWLKSNTPENVTIATDTKMSLLLLGVADRNSTFEGSSWLFESATLEASIAKLNAGEPPQNISGAKVILGQYTAGSGSSNTGFIERPIRYVLLADYMITGGADVSWFSAPLKPSPDLEVTLDQLGQRVYSHDGVIIWRLD